ncbi:MAG TPA: hypothetical protein VGO93_19990 [Candidatus Xenobia bacterium]|jgi:hypothetical protein
MSELRAFTNIGSLLAAILAAGGLMGHPTLLAMSAMCWLVSLSAGFYVGIRFMLAGKLSMERAGPMMVGYLIMLAFALWFVFDTLGQL